MPLSTAVVMKVLPHIQPPSTRELQGVFVLRSTNHISQKSHGGDLQPLSRPCTFRKYCFYMRHRLILNIFLQFLGTKLVWLILSLLLLIPLTMMSELL